MKFTCPKCQTRHHLADEELSEGNKRIACPSCGHALTLKRRPPGETAGAAGTSAQAPAQAAPLAPVVAPPVTQAPAAVAPPASAPAVPPAAEKSAALGATPFEDDGPGASDEEEPFPTLGESVNLEDPFSRPAPGVPRQTDSHLGTALLGTPVSAPPPPKDAAYFEAPPGADTQMFMNVAGIYRQRRNRRIGAVVALVIFALVGGVIVGDAKGLITMPWLGKLYAMSGIKDPNAGRVRKRAEAMAQQDTLSPAEREALRKKLMGGGDAAPADVPSTNKARPTKTFANNPTPSAAPTVATPAAAAPAALVERFDADGKREHVIGGDSDDKPAPGGLSQEQIYKVISDNNRSMGLCYGEAARKGEKLRGKMEVQITIEASGSVSEVSIETPKFRGTVMADCTIRRVKNWKFPKFTGESTSVVFPYMLSSSL